MQTKSKWITRKSDTGSNVIELENGYLGYKETPVSVNDTEKPVYIYEVESIGKFENYLPIGEIKPTVSHNVIYGVKNWLCGEEYVLKPEKANGDFNIYQIIKTNDPKFDTYTTATDIKNGISLYNNTLFIDHNFPPDSDDIPYVYMVRSYGGEYADAWETIEGIYEKKADAIKVAEEIWEENGNWQNHLPMPFDLYENTINGRVFQISTEPANIENDEYPLYYIFEDFGGYTKKEWIETYRIVEKQNYSDYGWTNVDKLPVRTTPMRYTNMVIQKTLVWSKLSRAIDLNYNETFDDANDMPDEVPF
jgi:hypothetical protein